MTNTQKIVISVLVLLVVLLGAGFYFSRKNDSPQSTGAAATFPESSSSSSGKATTLPPSKDASGGETIASSTSSVSETGGFHPILKKLTQTAIAGAVPLPTDQPVVRYTERETGHVVDISPITLETATVSNTTLPKTQNALWSSQGNFVVLQTISSIGVSTSLYKLSSEPLKETSLVPISFPKNTLDLVFSPDGTKIFFLEKNGFGVIGKTINLSTLTEKQIFSSPLSEWQLDWTNPKAITLTTKASAGVAGFSLSVDEKGGETRVLGEIPGLETKTSPDGSKIFYSSVAQDSPLSFIYETSTNNSFQYILSTLADKCVWSKKSSITTYCATPLSWGTARLPDEWYQGTHFTDDQIFGVGNGGVRILIDSASNRKGDVLDAENLVLDKNEQFLYFTNKIDGTLWSVQLYR